MDRPIDVSEFGAALADILQPDSGHLLHLHRHQFEIAEIYGRATGRALFQMRRCSWSDPDFSGVERMTIELLGRDKGRRIVVTHDELKVAWDAAISVAETLRRRRQAG